MTGTDAVTAIVLLDLAAMTAAGSLLAGLARRWGQPAVIGEIVAGIMLGPTMLGLLPGHLSQHLFPPGGRPFLTVLANVGLMLFMFGVGMELDVGTLKRSGSSAIAVSVVSTLVPLALGVGLAVAFYPWNRGGAHHSIHLLPFALFIGVAMSVTALPVLARILTGFRIHDHGVGAFALSCAAASDLIAWSMLAIVVALARGGGWTHVGWALAGIAAFAVALVVLVRPLLRVVLRWAPVRDRHGAPLLVLLICLLLSAWATTRLGFHVIFGAFAFGLSVPREELRRAVPEAPILVEQMSRLLVPIFFVTTGLSVDIADLGVRGLIEAALVLTAACLGKFAGAAGAARAYRIRGRKAATVGVLMNSRGLTELVVINIGLSLGVLTGSLASALVLMAVVTTMATTPLFRWLHDEKLENVEPATPAVAPAAPALENLVEEPHSSEEAVESRPARISRSLGRYPGS
jgi:Kef-type K+ transport system membrane component KefB